MSAKFKNQEEILIELSILQLNLANVLLPETVNSNIRGTKAILKRYMNKKLRNLKLKTIVIMNNKRRMEKELDIIN